MKTFRKGLFLVRFVCSCVMLAALYLCLGAPLYAQTQGQCPGDADSSQRGSGADVQCRVSNVLNKTQTLITNVQNRAGSCDSSTPHCSALTDFVSRAQHAHDRAVNANARMNGTDYADLNTIRKAKCKGAKSDCATGSSSATYSGGDSDSTVGSDVADQLDDSADSLDKANKEMQDSSTASATSAADPPPPPSTFVPLYEFDSDPNFEAKLVGAIDQHPLLDQFLRLQVLEADIGAESAKEITEDLCKQDVEVAGEGGNTSVACTPLTIYATAVKAVRELVDFAVDVTTEWEIHGTYQREDNLNTNLGQVDSDVLSVQAAAGNTQASITLLQNQVAALQVSINALQAQLANTTYVLSQKSNVSTDMDKQIMQLLLSPDGSRSLPASLLTCTGDSSTGSPCPPVAITCSATTGLCSFSPH